MSRLIRTLCNSFQYGRLGNRHLDSVTAWWILCLLCLRYLEYDLDRFLILYRLYHYYVIHCHCATWLGPWCRINLSAWIGPFSISVFSAVIIEEQLEAIHVHCIRILQILERIPYFEAFGTTRCLILKRRFVLRDSSLGSRGKPRSGLASMIQVFATSSKNIKMANTTKITNAWSPHHIPGSVTFTWILQGTEGLL